MAKGPKVVAYLVATFSFMCGSIGMTVSAGEAVPAFKTEIDFTSPEWNRDAWARISSDLDPSNQSIGRYRGQVLAVVDGEKIRVLCGFEGFAVSRLVRKEDGNYRRLNRETIIYTHPQTGEVLKTWKNPWTGEIVDVVHVGNDPFNYDIGTIMVLQPEDIGGEKPAEPIKIPLILPWSKVSEETLMLETDMHLFYPNALQPDKWPRESSGTMVQVSEMFRYFVSVAELQDRTRTSVNWHGTWNRVTPWLPWMLLGDKPGHVLYVGVMASADSINEISPNVLAYIKEHFPDFLTAPVSDYGPSLSSIEDYARRQKPVPLQSD